MTLDPVINFGKVTVSTGYDASALSIVLSTGDGSKLPDPASGNYNLVWWNSTDYPDPSDDPNKEIVRCTAKAVDTLTVTRAQESTSASTKNTSGKVYKMILAFTKLMRDNLNTDIHNTSTGHSHDNSDSKKVLWASIDKTTSNISDITTKSHTSLSDIGTNTHAQIDTAIGTTLPGLVTTHAALTNPHSSTAAATADRLMLRDAAGRCAVVAPSASTDIALKSTVTDDIATHAAVTATHGATGAVMGTTNTQNVSGKTFTDAIIQTAGTVIKPTADSTTALGIAQADGTKYVNFDTTNKRIGINTSTPNHLLEIAHGNVCYTIVFAPGACIATDSGLAGNVDIGAHIWKVTYVTAIGETEQGTASNTITIASSAKQVNLTAIPTASADNGVTSRKIYRTKAGGSIYYLLTTIADNTTTTYTDNIADSGLDSVDATNRDNTTMWLYYYPSSVGGYQQYSSIGVFNVSYGGLALSSITTGYSNTAFGRVALQHVTTGYYNVAMGRQAFQNLTTGYQNIAIGAACGTTLTTGYNCISIGNSANFGSNNLNNAIAIGASTMVNASSTWVIGAIGTKQAIFEGSNAAMGTSILVLGTVTVSNTLVTASSRIFLSRLVAGGTLGHLSVGTITVGTSFVINSSSATDTSTIVWEIKEPA